MSFLSAGLQMTILIPDFLAFRRYASSVCPVIAQIKGNGIYLA